LKLIWTDQALSDLEEIEAYIANGNPRVASLLAKQVYRESFVLRRNPYLGRVGQIDGTRELVIQRYPYLVIYEVTSGSVRVLSVFHTSRAWWLGGNDEAE
jgi:toxin ParE1/3/4